MSPKDQQDHYYLLHRILWGYRGFKVSDALNKLAPLFIVAYQISDSKERVATGLGDWLVRIKGNGHKELIGQVLRAVALNHRQLFEKLLAHGNRIQATWRLKAIAVAAQFGFDHTALPGKLTEYNGKTIPLARVVKRADNPFAHENALLTLANAVLDRKDALTDEGICHPIK